ncbi:MAG TPA: HRDC domain-containing protein [Tepidisphaeraceae bacterium]|nr:HRDC domain-containing protein [Tepidisphaeraceae bacterium]
MDSPITSHQAKSGQRRTRFPNRRALNHDSAHASAEDYSKNSPLPQIILTPPDLSALLDRLRQTGSFAYDSEFIGELTYLPQLCLIQVATVSEVALIDPLAGLDVTPFWDLVADASVEKIVHAGDQDVEPVFRHAQKPPANIFDTQIAAGFVGLPYPLALAKLVQDLTGARLGKSLTFTHWDQRPLSNHQLRYAADDVRYLPAVGAELRRRLEQNGHGAWAAEECRQLSVRGVYQFDPEKSYLRIRGANALSPLGLAILRQLSIWRDAAAQTEDVPPRTLLKDEVMVDLARSPVKQVDRLAKVRGLPRPVEEKYGQAIVDATATALSLPPAEFPQPRSYEPSPRERYLADALWAAGQTWCFGNGLDPNLLSSRQEIGDLCRCVERGEPTDNLPLLCGWRKEALGDKLLQLLKGHFRFGVSWQDGLRTVEQK